MDNFEGITVTKARGNKVNVVNTTNYLLIGQGAQGAVFKISKTHCIKIYAEPAQAELEHSAYLAAQPAAIVPKIFEKGANYLMMEYLSGPTLDHYLREQGTIPRWVTKQILQILNEMKLLKFTRIDSALRHIFSVGNQKLKIRKIEAGESLIDLVTLSRQ
jgi:predicted Ser/Thr protein kinase